MLEEKDLSDILKYKSKQMKSGVDFTNMLKSSFYTQRSQKHKKTVTSSVSFSLLGSSKVKAAHKMTPD